MRRKSIKFLVVGDAIRDHERNSLKTALLHAYKDEEPFAANAVSPMDSHGVLVSLGAEDLDLYLQDCSGSELYERIMPTYYQGTDVVLLVFHYHSTSSLENAKTKWVPEIKYYLQDRPIVLVGVKDNFIGMELNSKVELKTAKKMAKEMGVDIFIECSLGDNDSVKKVFYHALAAALASEESTRSLAKSAFQAFTKNTVPEPEEMFIFQAIEIAKARRNADNNNFFSHAPIDIIKKILVELARAEGCERDPRHAIDLIFENVRFKKAANWQQFTRVAEEEIRIFDKRNFFSFFYKDFACFYSGKLALALLEKEPERSTCTIC